MEEPLSFSPAPNTVTGPSSLNSRSSQKLDDVASLTSFNPFSEEDENDQSSYTLVTSLFSRMKNSLSAPLSVVGNSPVIHNGALNDQRRPSVATNHNPHSTVSNRSSNADKPISLAVVPSNPAPPVISLDPVVSEAPSFSDYTERTPSRGGMYTPLYETNDSGVFGTSIPGFPIPDDTRSIRTVASVNRSGSVSKVIRRIRGEGLSRDYWMDDENCKECYDCKSVFTAWRRKHHCRICGQIFCSRCASNIIKGSRFGHDGMVRVCNLCLEKLATVDDDDDDDRRSIVSSSSPFPAHQQGTDSFGIGYHAQSPFAASQLFGRTDEPFNLYSIAETKRLISGSDDSGWGSRPVTPSFTLQDDHIQWEPVRENPAPFRRALTDEEKDPENMPNSFNSNDHSPTAPGSKTPIDFPVTIPISIEGPGNGTTSSVQFPVSSPEHERLDSPRPSSTMRSRFNSYGDFDVPTPFMRSRVQSRLDQFSTGEPGWRTRRESTAYAQELNLISMYHLRVMLRQMLTSEEIPNIKEWEETLLKLSLQIARELTFTAYPHRQGEDMDVRRYVKIKKIPGGSPSDSEYVDGAVITKNVAHKQMSRLQRNPRVMLVTFPLEFYRVEGQYMHFGQIVRQEKEYLGNLASRIAALRPHVVLVEKSVSRLALDALAKHNIAVARTVKPSAVQFVARMTQADVFSSMDRLALEPRLGHCSKFRIQTYDHPLIPGRRKTYMRFEGCSRDMGCTIILRGGDIDTLRRIKKVTRFLTFIVRNLKLETHLWKDSVITVPSLIPDAIAPSSPGVRPPLAKLLVPSIAPSIATPTVVVPSKQLPDPTSLSEGEAIDEDLPDEDAEQIRLSRRINQSLEPYKNTFISVSATLRFPLPQPIRRMKELDDELINAKHAWEDDLVRREEKESFHTQEETIISTSMQAADTDANDVNAQIEALTVPEIPRTPTPRNDSLPNVEDDGGYFSPRIATTGASLHPGSFFGSSPLASPIAIEERLQFPLKKAVDIALQSHLSYVKWQHEEQRRIWEWYLRKNQDDFVVEKYQNMSIWEYTIPIAEFGLHRACFAPQLRYITFYGENDCTLGRFIEKSVTDTLVQFLDPKAICAGKGCNQPLARHCKVFVHNETRLFVAVEQWDGLIKGRAQYPAPDLITTWSACRICGMATPFIPVSDEMQRYSFAKFLELYFYPADVQLVQGAGCQHNIYQHHIRYFASKGMTVRFQADPVVLHEVVYPPMRIRVRPETQLELKNLDWERLHGRNVMWYGVLVEELKWTAMEAATGDEEADARLTSDINKLIARAEKEREEVKSLIDDIYKNSSPMDTLALNRVRSIRQDKIVAWQQDFDGLQKLRASQMVDRHGRKISALGSVRAMWPRKHEHSGTYDIPNMHLGSVSEADENSVRTRSVRGDSFTSSASDVSEPEAESTSAELPAKASAPTSESEAPPSTESSMLEVVQETGAKSDPESDSTIGAGRDDLDHAPLSPPQGEQSEVDLSSKARRASKLPKRSSHYPNVASLVKKYSGHNPPQSVHGVVKTAMTPPVSESEQEYAPGPSVRHVRDRSRHRQHPSARKSSTSDFEHSYAANIAPRYLTHSRRSLVRPIQNSRIPGPVVSSLESQPSSRRTSPEKRSSRLSSEISTTSGYISPTQGKNSVMVHGGGKSVRGKASVRGSGRDKHSARQASTSNNKQTFRRQPGGPGSKVGSIAKYFEKINKDTERANRHYAVIRGRRARPVASARAKVEVLDSVKDAIRDESESSDSFSEADDEGGDEDEARKATDEITTEPSPEASGTYPDVTLQAAEGPGTPPTQDSRESDAKASQPVAKAPSTFLNSSPNVELIREAFISLPPSPFLSTNVPLTPPHSDIDSGTERSSIMKAFSGFWAPQTQSRRVELDHEDLMSDSEHIFRDSSMVVRTDEPTSIIALALNSPQYRDMLKQSRAEKRTSREPKLTTDSGEAFMPDDCSVAESTSTWGVVNIEAADIANPMDELRMPSSKLPWAISFESGGLTISCTVLYPEQFDALRRTYDCEKSMIESLARCVKWNAGGGKSGSAFLKTQDDRFIAKELSKPELQTMETFAPAYFDYMSSAITANRPTLLAKVFGCYKLTFKKSKQDKQSGKSKVTQMNLLVMENLFYDRRFSKIYDLKGSTRNRHVQSTGRENEVLLDENLVETAHLSPFYLREHSKRILRGALYNDSKFLADINVMDYSLVVGVDSQNNELVVGIVDYIRTYTWDKKLESWVKESAFLGGAGKGEPTIVTPKQYRQRFCSAMERYFPLVPDRWMKQRDTPEEDSNLLELWPDW